MNTLACQRKLGMDGLINLVVGREQRLDLAGPDCRAREQKPESENECFHWPRLAWKWRRAGEQAGCATTWMWTRRACCDERECYRSKGFRRRGPSVLRRSESAFCSASPTAGS